MADRRKLYDVDDSVRLRRAALASDGFVDDKYYKRWFAPHSHYTNGTYSQFNGLTSSIVCAPAGDRFAISQMEWPEHWRNGRLEITSYHRHANAVALDAMVIEHEASGLNVADPIVFKTIISAVQQTIVLAAPAAQTSLVSVSSESTSVVQRGNYDIIGFRTERLGTDPADTTTVNTYFIGALLRWKPEPLN
jgi:hypothetical protein